MNSNPSNPDPPGGRKPVYSPWLRYSDQFPASKTPGWSRAQFWTLAARLSRYRIQDLADNCRLHLRQIERRCKEELGRAPEEWLTEQRMIAARFLLLETESIKRTAMELEYKHVSHFSRQFKKFYGITPTEYLLLQRQLNGNVALV